MLADLRNALQIAEQARLACGRPEVDFSSVVELRFDDYQGEVKAKQGRWSLGLLPDEVRFEGVLHQNPVTLPMQQIGRPEAFPTVLEQGLSDLYAAVGRTAPTDFDSGLLLRIDEMSNGPIQECLFAAVRRILGKHLTVAICDWSIASNAIPSI